MLVFGLVVALKIDYYYYYYYASRNIVKCQVKSYKKIKKCLKKKLMLKLKKIKELKLKRNKGKYNNDKNKERVMWKPKKGD